VEYEAPFPLSFMERTRALVRDYRGPYDSTLLVNCLLGLLLVPKEAFLELIPEDPPEFFAKWGFGPDSVRSFGKPTKKTPRPETLRGVVHSLRNAVAHFRFVPKHQAAEVVAFDFHDLTGFAATLTVEETRQFIEAMAAHLEKAAQPAR
jgi:hypothetical protein